MAPKGDANGRRGAPTLKVPFFQHIVNSQRSRCDIRRGVRAAFRFRKRLSRVLCTPWCGDGTESPLTEIDYVAWIEDVFRRKPHLTQAGLARHMDRHRSVMTAMLQRKRKIKADEIAQIASYLGEPPPGSPAMALDSVPIVGRIGSAWYEDGEMPPVGGQVSAVIERAGVRQVAYRVDDPVLGLPRGAIVIAIPLDGRTKPVPGQTVVVKRERAGLVNTTLVDTGDGEVDGTPIAVAIEARLRLS